MLGARPTSALAQILGQPRHHERQHVGAARVAHQEELLFVPGSEVVTRDAGEIPGRLIGGLPGPEVAQRVEPHDGHPFGRHLLTDVAV
jgi:hypothetical protein